MKQTLHSNFRSARHEAGVVACGVTHPRRAARWLGVSLAIVFGTVALGEEPKLVTGNEDFTKMSLEDLASIKVTTVSKKEETLSDVPAAVSVITDDDIRRSGASSLPEALRMAPGTEVARVDSHQWAVSVRGFNDTFAQKVLVLMDGRSIYTPLFSGTIWQVQNTLLEDVNRIEVIRGPGGTIWGANAVNGVINIVSKPARETQGVLLSAGGGSEHIGLAGARYGAQIGEHTFFRMYGKFDAWDNLSLIDGSEADDRWHQEQGGFRLDWDPSAENRFTLQGDIYDNRAEQVVPQISLTPPYGSSLASHWNQQGGNILGRWSHQFSQQSDVSVQTYYDRSVLDMPLLGENDSTFDLDARHRLPLGERQEIVWGGGYRVNQSQMQSSPEISFTHRSSTDQILNLFAQDEITLVPERLRLTLGSKVEHNDYTGVEFEPNGRLAWTPDKRQTWWASVGRAVRTPSRIESDGKVALAAVPPSQQLPVPTLVSIVGNRDFTSEKLIAYELGYRVKAHRKLTLDAAGFVNSYDELRGTRDRLNLNGLPDYLESQSLLANNVHGETFGGEIAATWELADWWRLRPQVTYIRSDLSGPPSALTGLRTPVGIASPPWQASLRSSMDLGHHVELDGWLRYSSQADDVGIRLPSTPASTRDVPDYVTLDVRIGWRPNNHWEFSIVGQNLIGSAHREFNPTFVSTQFTEVGRSVYGKITWRF